MLKQLLKELKKQAVAQLILTLLIMVVVLKGTTLASIYQTQAMSNTTKGSSKNKKFLKDIIETNSLKYIKKELKNKNGKKKRQSN
jgi:hypothetical protein